MKNRVVVIILASVLTLSALIAALLSVFEPGIRGREEAGSLGTFPIGWCENNGGTVLQRSSGPYCDTKEIAIGFERDTRGVCCVAQHVLPKLPIEHVVSVARVSDKSGGEWFAETSTGTTMVSREVHEDPTLWEELTFMASSRGTSTVSVFMRYPWDDPSEKRFFETFELFMR